IAQLLTCCILLQALIAGLHAAQFIDHQLIANDPSICHGGNTGPSVPRSDLPDTCCLLGCNSSAPTARLSKPIAVSPPQVFSARILLCARLHLKVRSHLNDRAHSRPRSPPSA